jgi:hypothetical protein
VFWSRRGSTTELKSLAYLLRLSSLHQCFHRYHSEMLLILGRVNQMANDCSRLRDLSYSQLLPYFNLHYPQPRSWRMCNVSATMKSALISALSAKPSKLQSFIVVPPPPPPPPTTQHWAFDNASVFHSARTNSSAAEPILSSCSNSSPSATVTGELSRARGKSNLEPWRMVSVPRARDSPNWGQKTFA